METGDLFGKEDVLTLFEKEWGGMTTYYKEDGRLKFAEELQAKHPDVVKVTWKFHRWHHQVNYKPFKRNELILKDGLVIPKGVNNYGMKLVKIK